MAVRYWVGGSGSTTGTTHWSTSSGGASGASTPGSGDSVIFDANSGGGSVTWGIGVSLAGITMTGFAGAMAGGGLLNLTGNAVLVGASGMDIQFTSPTATQTLTSNGSTLGSLSIVKNFTALDALNCTTIFLGQGASGGVVTLKEGATHFITALSVTSASTLQSALSGTRALLSDASGINRLDGLTVQDMEFVGGASWFSGTGYVDNGNVLGVTSEFGTNVPALFFGVCA